MCTASGSAAGSAARGTRARRVTASMKRYSTGLGVDSDCSSSVPPARAATDIHDSLVREVLPYMDIHESTSASAR